MHLLGMRGFAAAVMPLGARGRERGMDRGDTVALAVGRARLSARLHSADSKNKFRVVPDIHSVSFWH
jgi:hypothetical protein